MRLVLVLVNAVASSYRTYADTVYLATKAFKKNLIVNFIYSKMKSIYDLMTENLLRPFLALR